MKTTGTVLLALVLLFFAGEAEAQARDSDASQPRFDQSFGGQLSYGLEDRAMGLGLRSETRVNPVPVALAISWDYFFPRCGVIGCSLWQAHANAKVDLGRVLPFDPFIGGGIHYRSFSQRLSSGTDRQTGTGLNILGGIWTGPTFLEARYEITEDLDNQFVFSLGLTF